MSRYRRARCCSASYRSTMSPRRCTKSRASKTACCEAISRARRTNKAPRHCWPRRGDLIPSQQKDGRTPCKLRPLEVPPRTDCAAHDLFARQGQVDRHAQAQFGTARREHRGEKRLVSVRRLDEQLRRAATAERVVERAQRLFARAG